MAGISRLKGFGQFWDDSDGAPPEGHADRVTLWNRLEFEKGDGWARVVIGSAKPGGKSDDIFTRNFMMVMLVGWIMAVLVECGGEDIETNMIRPVVCPYCEEGYIPDDEGNYQPCPVCRGRD